MAKKNKKLLKLNQAIRQYFDDDGFDEGIERVDEATLVALAHAIGVYDGTTKKSDLIRLYRRLWSDADAHIRELIVDFFKSEGVHYPRAIKRERNIDKLDKINELLDAFEIDDDERRDLISIFIDTKTRKITPLNIEIKLEYIRYINRRLEIEKELDITFNYDDSFEFYAPLTYTIGDITFSKIGVIKSAVIDDEKLRGDGLRELLTQLKHSLTNQKQEQLNRFLKSLDLDNHRYLERDEILSLLKGSSPSDKIYPIIDADKLESVLKSAVSVVGSDVVVRVDSSFVPPFATKSYSYKLELHIDIDELSRQIWLGEEIDLGIERASIEAESQFVDELEQVVLEARDRVAKLGYDDEMLYNAVYEILFASSDFNLHISHKLYRKTLFEFNKAIEGELLKKQRQSLLAKTIRDFKNLFPLARSLRRRLILHVGPTNSGKTYTAFESLKSADTGYFLAPLRLLALEGYEDLKSSGIDASLITGEEQIMSDSTTHISSTIEMLNFDSEVDVAVIDEVQMIGDRDRGWAWANAIIGAPAKTLIMTGSSNAIEAIKALAEYLDEPLEIVEFTRKSPLELMRSVTPLDNIEPNTAVITFSRSQALRLKQQLSSRYRVSIIYGNLSPEVRREEARRFREGETEILVATDAISMGLNLPIKTILFSRADKFDGVKDRILSVSEIQQIAGRAGRYGLHEHGFVGAIDKKTLSIITAFYHNEPEQIKIPFGVMANFDHVMLVSNILEEQSLSKIIEFFVENMQFEGPFRAVNLDSMQEASKIIDRYDLQMREKFILASAPLSTSSPLVMSSYERYIRALVQKKPIAFIPPKNLGRVALTSDELLEAEDRIKEISLYLWLSYRLGEYFIDSEKAKSYRAELNRFIENSLKESHFRPRCRLCSKPLPLNYEFGICQSCFIRNNRANKAPKRYGR